MNLNSRDKKLIWHPFTQEKTAGLPMTIKKGQGSYLYDEKDNAYLDLISSWWVNLYGHAHPEIAQSIYQQATTLEHVIFAGFTHEPAVQLCETLNSLLPPTLSRFFFSDNGSTSIEVALKMAYQYWKNKEGKERKLFICLEGGYHGDTFGAMSVGSECGYHDHFRELFFNVLSIPFPATWDNDKDAEEKESRSLAILQGHLEQNPGQIAALIVEPLVQGASGMRMCRPSFIKKAGELVHTHDSLLIFDEVMTGFGRTGSNFAMEQTGIVPDFLCLSKGITGGFLPLALTVTSHKIYEAFLSDEWKHAFSHGHSYTANPLACAAAVTATRLLQSDATQQAILAINKAHQQGLATLKSNCRHIMHTRIQGTIAAFDFTTPAQGKRHTGSPLPRQFMNEGLILRPIGNTIYLIPPYSTTPEELIKAYEKIEIVLRQKNTF